MRARLTLGIAAAIVLAVPAFAAETDEHRLPPAGARLERFTVRAAESAVVHFAERARADALRRPLSGALAPLVILQGEETVEGEDELEEPFTGTPLESYAFPVPGLA